MPDQKSKLEGLLRIKFDMVYRGQSRGTAEPRFIENVSPPVAAPQTHDPSHPSNPCF